MKKLAYTVLLSLSALLIAFGLTAVEAPPEPVDHTELTIPEAFDAPQSEATEVAPETAAEIVANGVAEPTLDPDTNEPIDAAVSLCNCKLGPQVDPQCPTGWSCQACPCLSVSSKINGVCKQL